LVNTVVAIVTGRSFGGKKFHDQLAFESRST